MFYEIIEVRKSKICRADWNPMDVSKDIDVDLKSEVSQKQNSLSWRRSVLLAPKVFNWLDEVQPEYLLYSESTDVTVNLI